MINFLLLIHQKVGYDEKTLSQCFFWVDLIQYVGYKILSFKQFDM